MTDDVFTDKDVILKIVRASNGWVIKEMDGTQTLATDTCELHDEIVPILQRY